MSSLLQRAKDASTARKHFLLAMLFVFSTSVQVYIGLKCNKFDWRHDDETLEAVMMCLSVFWVNVEARRRLRVGERRRGRGRRSPTPSRARASRSED